MAATDVAAIALCSACSVFCVFGVLLAQRCFLLGRDYAYLFGASGSLSSDSGSVPSPFSGVLSVASGLDSESEFS